MQHSATMAFFMTIAILAKPVASVRHNLKVVLISMAMIPGFRPDGTLPPGVHVVKDWDEIMRVFGRTAERQALLQRLRNGLENLRDAGCPWVLLDGSFTTNKPSPADVDGCWKYVPHLDESVLDEAFWLEDFVLDRRNLLVRFGMDFFIADAIEAGSGRPFSAFFQTDRDGYAKGIVRLDLNRLL